MDGLPFLPGFRFNDLTKHNYRLSPQFRWKNGYAIPNEKAIGIGKDPLDVDSILYNDTSGKVGCFDPTLTYGKAKDPPKPIVLPHFVIFDRKCLSFIGYTMQNESESSLYTCRVRCVKITYFLVDDTISIIEPATENAGYVQGCILKRGPIPNPHRKNRTWHWSDFNVGLELSFYGVMYKLCSCDSFTKQFLSSQGVALGPDVPVPNDPYVMNRLLRQQQLLSKTPGQTFDCREADANKIKQFLEYDGQVLRFYVVWDDDKFEPAQWKYFVLLYFMADDRVEIHESKEKSHFSGQIQPTTFLSKMKLPVEWSNIQPPGVKEYEKYYQPKDLIIGNTILVLGRRCLLYDCDIFTRNFFEQKLQIVQPEPIQVIDARISGSTVYQKVIPPHTGIGDPADTRQNCLSLMPKPPKTVDFVTYVLNATKKLRYKLKILPVYEEDKLRDFIMEFCLGNDHMNVTELAGKNSGFIRGRYMASARLRKPGTNVDDNLFYGTKDFALGAELCIKGSVFEIVELDLWTYNYMISHKYKFTQEAIDGAKLFLENKGLLNPEQKICEA